METRTNINLTCVRANRATVILQWNSCECTKYRLQKKESNDNIWKTISFLVPERLEYRDIINCNLDIEYRIFACKGDTLSCVSNTVSLEPLNIDKDESGNPYYGISPFMKKTVNIFGSCVSREPCNYIPSYYNIGIKEYIHKVSPLFFLSTLEKNNDNISESEVNSPHNFVKRSICTLLNDCAVERLLSNKGDWIIIDDLYFASKVYQISNTNDPKDCRLIQMPDEIRDEVFRIIETSKSYSHYKISNIVGSPNYVQLLPRLIEFLKTNWGNNIILIESASARYTINEEGNCINRSLNDESNLLKKLITSKLVSELNCWYIPLPPEIYSRDLSSVHYGYEIYDYIGRCIGEIIQKQDLDKNCSKYYLDLQVKLSKILIDAKEAKHLIIHQIDDVINNKIKEKYESTLELCLDHLDLSGAFHSRLAQMYMYGIGVKCDLNQARKYAKAAIDLGDNSVHIYFDILWKINSKESLNEMIFLGNTYLKMGNPLIAGRMARVYSMGCGVNKDNKKAIELYLNAVSKNVYWALYELLDLLWDMNTNESLSQMINLEIKYSSNNDPNVVGRLGKAYYFGKGVNESKEMANKYIGIAAEKSQYWKNELNKIQQ